MKEGDRLIGGRDVRLIGKDGSQLGVVPFKQACLLAKGDGLDLIAVAEQTDPPVCKIIDYGKYLYEQRKKEKDQKKHQHAQKHKEVRFSASIDPHDYSIKVDHAIEFLKKDYKVKVSMMFRGREMAHKEIGFEVMGKVLKALEPFGEAESPPKLIGRSIIMSFNSK